MNQPTIEVLHGRHNHLIDPSLHIWGWEIPVYLFLGGVVAGLLILSAALELVRGSKDASLSMRMAPFVALVLLSLGMLALFLDLEHKLYTFRFYLAFEPTSPMSWGSWILVLVYPVAFLLGMGSLPEDTRARLIGYGPFQKLRISSWLMCVFGRADSLRRPLLWASVVAGAALGIYTGILLGALSARPQWDTAILGPLFLTSGLSTGAAFLLLLPLDHEERHKLVRWDLLAIGAEIGLIAIMLIGFAAGDRAGQMALANLTTGNWGGAFWVLVVLVGLLVPLVMDLIEVRRRLAPVFLAPLFVLVGGLSLRFIMLASGQASSFRMIQ